MPHLDRINWDYADRMQSANLGGGGEVWYDYDATGERVRKVIENRNLKEDRKYLDGYEIYTKTNNGTIEVERETLHVYDGTKRIAILDYEEKATTIRYQYDNHLGSACLELDEKAKIITYEEYHPFGTTSYRSGRKEIETSLKRYKYVGKERDDETGMYYYGARYYAAWLCRFVSVDPLQHKYPHYTPYQYAGNKPITFIDLDGLEEEVPEINKYNQKPGNLPPISPDDRFTDFVERLIPKPKGYETPKEMEKIMDQQEKASEVVENTTEIVKMINKGTAAVGIGVLAAPIVVEGTVAAIPYLTQGANASIPYLAQGALAVTKEVGMAYEAIQGFVATNQALSGAILQIAGTELSGVDPISNPMPSYLSETISVLSFIRGHREELKEAGEETIMAIEELAQKMQPDMTISDSDIPLMPADNTNIINESIDPIEISRMLNNNKMNLLNSQNTFEFSHR